MPEKRNPFVYQSRLSPHTFSIGFDAARRSNPEPLWWTGQGFKDLGRVRGQPEEFETKVAAEQKVTAELLDFIRKWRADQAHLIAGWESNDA